jgi:hypothetical protein
VHAHGGQQLADVATSRRCDQLGKRQLGRILSDRPRAQLCACRMTAADESILERTRALKAPTQCGTEREVARCPQPRECKGEQGATVAAIARRNWWRERDDRVEQLRVVGERQQAWGREHWKRRVDGHVLLLATYHVRTELLLVDRPRDRAEKEGQKCPQVARAVVDGRGAEQHDTGANQSLREMAVTYRPRRSRMVRLIQNDEVVAPRWHRRPTEGLIRSIFGVYGASRARICPHGAEHRRPHDERAAGLRRERQRDERLPEADVIGDERPAMLLQRAPGTPYRLTLVRAQCDAA